MNADRLLAHFDTLVDTPGAVPRLRRFILDLAVRGRLVPQDPNDQPVSELLERNESEEARLMELGQLRRCPPLPAVARDRPHDIPATWSWVRLGQIVSFSTGRTPRRNEPSYWNSGDYAWVSIRDMNDGAVLTSTKETVTKKAKEEIFRDEPEQAGTMLMSFKLTIGKVTRIGIPAYHNEAIIAIRPHVPEIDPYLFSVLAVFAQQGNTKAAIKGATLNRTSLSNIPVPLPPVAEQHRITSRIDELMTMCHQLTIAGEKREEARDRFTATSLARLSAPDRPAFRAHAVFTINNLDRLTARSDQISALRRTILDLAVLGRLVPHESNDEPASEILRRIASEKRRMVDAGEIRRQKPRWEASVGSDAPFSLPADWAWSRVAEIGVVNPRNNAPDDVQASFVPMSMIAFEYGVPHRHEVRRWGEIKSGYTHFAEGDVGVAKITPCFENGKSTIFRNLAGGMGSGTTELHVVRPLFVDPRYVVLFFKSSYFIEPGIPKMTGTAGQKRVPATYWANAPFPLPPLPEQHRIVRQVDEMMALCDRLEGRLVTTDDTRRRLLDSMLHEAVDARRAAALTGGAT